MALAPEHLADLRASGLEDATIAACGYEAVRPHDIKIQGVHSAYRIPYPALDGAKNGFERWRFFPAIQRADGSKQKYFQPAGSAPHLYLCPCCNWASVAKDSSVPLIIPEGEKKAAKACQEGLAAIGVAGLWNWRQKLDNGERLVIPTLDQFVWNGRDVLLVPDSDAWRPEREVDLLAGFYALGQELVFRGANVRLLRLPERAGVKIGLDDWLVATGAEWNSSWPHLERFALDDERLRRLAAWWQKWREKTATERAIRQRGLEDLEVEETAGLYTVRVPQHTVCLVFDRLQDQRGGVGAELTITLGSTELLSGVDLGLKSDTGQTKLSTSLNKLTNAIPWKAILQRACSLVLRRYRTGTPTLILTGDMAVEPLTYVLNPIAFKKKTTVLYGDGGLGKSSLALFLGMCVSAGQSLVGFRALKGRALYLDYEDDGDVHVRRLQAILRGHPELTGATIHYQRCTEPLSRLTSGLVRLIQGAGITFVILDSIMAATGGDSSAEAAAKLFAALRQLDTTALALGHVPKTVAEGQDHQTVYGSVFHQNFARSVFEIQKRQEVGEDGAILALIHRKSNLSRLHHPIGLRMSQNADSTELRYEPCDLNQVVDMAKTLPAAAQIRNLLDDGQPRIAKQIAEETELKLATVKSTLSKHQGYKWQMIGGPGQETLWTVLTPRLESK